MVRLRCFILIVCIIFLLSGCKSIKEVSLDSIIIKILDTTSLDSMQKGDGKSLKRYFGLNPGDFEEFIIYTPSYNMDVEELLILKVESEEQVDMVELAIESRVDKQIETFGSYGPKQCALLEEYELKIVDNYIFYTVSNKSNELTKIFKDSIMK